MDLRGFKVFEAEEALGFEGKDLSREWEPKQVTILMSEGVPATAPPQHGTL